MWVSRKESERHAGSHPSLEPEGDLPDEARSLAKLLVKLPSNSRLQGGAHPVVDATLTLGLLRIGILVDNLPEAEYLLAPPITSLNNTNVT